MQPALAPAPHPNMQSSAQDHADQVLHDQLLAAQQRMQGSHPQGAPQQQHLQPNTASPRDQANIDPAISGAAMLSAAPHTPTQPQQGSPDDGSPKTYGKRELSTSKRAAQNRAAQRAFRQRKETYIRKLEEEVKSVEPIREQLKALITENIALREYAMSLHNRLQETTGEYPEVPPNVDLHNPRHDLLAASGLTGPSAGGITGGPAQQGQHSGAGNADMNSLNSIAAAGLHNFQGQPNKRGRADENQGDGSGGAPKQEPGLSMA